MIRKIITNYHCKISTVSHGETTMRGLRGLITGVVPSGCSLKALSLNNYIYKTQIGPSLLNNSALILLTLLQSKYANYWKSVVLPRFASHVLTLSSGSKLERKPIVSNIDDVFGFVNGACGGRFFCFCQQFDSITTPLLKFKCEISMFFVRQNRFANHEIQRFFRKSC